jgi:hypothetical protein
MNLNKTHLLRTQDFNKNFHCDFVMKTSKNFKSQSCKTQKYTPPPFAPGFNECGGLICSAVIRFGRFLCGKMLYYYKPRKLMGFWWNFSASDKAIP